MKKIIVVEDEKLLHFAWKRALRDKTDIEYVEATSIDEAREAFDSNDSIALIAVDGCVPGGKYNTAELIHHFRDSCFAGPIVAISDDRDIRQLQMKDGCTHEAKKDQVVATIIQLLQQAPA